MGAKKEKKRKKGKQKTRETIEVKGFDRLEEKNEKNQPGLNRSVLSTFPREGLVRVINEIHRRENRHSSVLHRKSCCREMCVHRAASTWMLKPHPYLIIRLSEKLNGFNFG